jgi:tetratricopeptide (TPR) repeat protein
LDQDRLPARLAGPLRFQIDPAYRQAQAPDAQAALQKQLDRGQASGLVPLLRALQVVLADPDELPKAFRMAEPIYGNLRQQAPHLAARLAACFHWVVVSNGMPEDVNRFQRVFGSPPDDPQLFRLRALQAEANGAWQAAHDNWQKFERSVADNPAIWPGEQARRVRALVWCHIGDNAAKIPDPDKMPGLPDFLRNHPDRPRPLSPSAPSCFERSLKLAPDYLEAHEALLHYYLEQEDTGNAERAARQLLEHFPEHARTLEELGDLRMAEKDYVDALALYLRALKANPLQRGLRDKVGTAYALQARQQAEAGTFEEARQSYQTALTYKDAKDRSSFLCKWAACEFKAGNSSRAEDLIQQALTQGGSRLGVAYNMLVETIRFKLTPALKKRFTKEFDAALAEAPTDSAASDLATSASTYKVGGVTYYGQKAHNKKVLTYLEKALKSTWTEEHLQTTCLALRDLEAWALLRKFAALGQTRFRANPRFPLVIAESYLSQGPGKYPPWTVKPLLARAAELAAALPPGDEREELLQSIRHHQQLVGIADMFGGGMLPEGMLEDFLGQMMGDEDMDFEDDY